MDFSFEYNDLVEQLSKTFRTVFLASCFSKKYVNTFSNVIGFDGLLDVKTFVKSLYGFLIYKNNLSEITKSQLSEYLLNVYPQHFYPAENLKKVLREMFLGYNVNEITLREGSQNQPGETNWGCAHINQGGTAMTNDHIWQLILRYHGLYSFPWYDIVNNHWTRALLILRLLPTALKASGYTKEYAFSYLIVQPRPDLPVTTELTIINGDLVGWEKTTIAGLIAANLVNRALNLAKNLLRRHWEIPWDQDDFPIPTPIPAGAAESAYVLSQILPESHEEQIETEVNELFNDIIMLCLFGVAWIIMYLLIPYLRSLPINTREVIMYTLLVLALALILVACLSLQFQIIPFLVQFAGEIAFIIAAGCVLIMYNPTPGEEDDDFDGFSNTLEEGYYAELQITNPDLALQFEGSETTWMDVFEDYDEDEVQTWVEIDENTNPLKADTDDDGINDNIEILEKYPDYNDDDDDGILNYVEEEYYCYYNQHIANSPEEEIDSDDKLVWLSTNDDTDGDGLTTCQEMRADSHPLIEDTDGDGLFDNEEVEFDGDSNLIYNSNPSCVDTDHDGVGDFEEVNYYYTNPVNPDSDGDELLDGWEIYGSIVGWNDGALKLDETKCDPNAGISDQDWYLSDDDNDGLNLIEESIYFTCPLLSDTDGDGVTDSDEINIYYTDPTTEDTDKDGLLDNEEINTYSTNSLKTDTDGDEMPDKWELDNNLDPLVDELFFPLSPLKGSGK